MSERDSRDAAETSAARVRALRVVVAVVVLALTSLSAALVLREVYAGERYAETWPVVAACATVMVLLGLMAAIRDARRQNAAPGAPRLVEGPPSERRAAIVIAIGCGLVVLVQALIPLRYYLSDDPFDERFSWRMFSAVRVQRCRLSVYEDRPGGERATPVLQQVQVAWKELMERNRDDVTEHYLRFRCDESAERVTVVNACLDARGEPAPALRRAIDCETGEIDRDPPKEHRRKGRR